MIHGELGRCPLHIDIKQGMVSYWTKRKTGKQSNNCSVVHRLMVIKFTSCLPMVCGSLRVLRLLPPLKLVAMI